MTLNYKAQKISGGGKVVIAPEAEPTAVAYVPDATLKRVATASKHTKFKAAVKLVGGERAKALREIQPDLFKLVNASVCKQMETAFK